MTRLSLARAATVLALAGAPYALPAQAAITDYEFQLVETELKEGPADIAVRLIDKRTGQPVPGAIIFATRADMQPDGMETMTSGVEAVASSVPGIYRFRVQLTMEGNWRLSLAAKIQGEAGTLQGRLVLRARP
jgi:hypothetical protein